MGFLSAFIEREPKVEEAKTKPKTVASPMVSQNTFKIGGNSSTPEIKTDVYNSGNATQDALDYFSKLLKEKDFQGTDYFEFTETLKNPAFSIIASEQGKYAAVFAGLAASGLTKEKLISTANDYISLIDADLENIEGTFKQAYQEKVQNKRDAIEAKNKEMQELNQKIQQLTSDVLQLGTEATENENTLTSNKNSFISAGNTTKDKITADIQKIQTFL